ncbi:hypothetical protein E2C01_013531 [Portunus trituberculatus]|uniref:Uncharacterized protein n=1 Tax=Portunus trituberculatus TaxID=210409 RepID=A0A5B7DGV5_PORTR|nr:hypothetical protein [Portunus trituberculatus]
MKAAKGTQHTHETSCFTSLLDNGNRQPPIILQTANNNTDSNLGLASIVAFVVLSMNSSLSSSRTEGYQVYAEEQIDFQNCRFYPSSPVCSFGRNSRYAVELMCVFWKAPRCRDVSSRLKSAKARFLS